MDNRTHRQSEDWAQMFPKDSLEYKLLLRYTQKKKATNSHLSQSSGVEEAKDTLPTQPQLHRKSCKPKKRKLLKLISCIRTEEEDDYPETRPRRQPATAYSSTSDQKEVDQIVNNLTKLTDSVNFTSSDIEPDGYDLVERIVELLREQGDKLNEEIEKDHMLRKQLQDALSYSFFTNVTQTFMQKLSPEELPNTQSPQQAEIALTFELTSRLSTIDCHPMNRVLGFGAKYLHDYLTPWVTQQGGYEKVFGADSDAEEEVQ